MRSSTIFFLAICCSLLIFAPEKASAQQLEALLQAADDYRAPGPDFTATVKVSAPGSAPLQMDVFVNNRVKSLVRYVKPAKSRGRALLFISSNMWVYVPGTRRALRISPNQQILGGVSSADIARTVLSIDYKASAVEEVASASGVKGGPFKELRLVPRKRGTAYARIDLLIDSKNRPRRAIFFSKSKRKLKTAYFSKFKQAAGQVMALKMTVVDNLDGGTQTTINYSNIRQESTPKNWFQPNYLPRIR